MVSIEAVHENMQEICKKYVENMQENMQKICKICRKYVKICRKYAGNMQEICRKYAEKYAENMQNMQNTWTSPKICKICTFELADDSRPAPGPSASRFRVSLHALQVRVKI